MKFKYFDIHSHFNIDKYDGGISAAIARMKEKEVGTICVGTDLETSKKAVEIAEKSEGIWATVGQHPTDTDEAFDIAEYERLARHSRVVAIGECGLDYYRLKITDLRFKEIQEQQKALFKKQIELAIKVGKPLMIHARPSKGSMDAYIDALDILSNVKGQLSNAALRANFHFFVGDISIARQIIEQGWSVSFDGPITFSRDYDEVIKSIPIENIMAETDAPFASPEPYRGKTCEPWMVEEVYKKIAEIKELDSEKVRLELLTNAERVFGIDLARK